MKIVKIVRGSTLFLISLFLSMNIYSQTNLPSGNKSSSSTNSADIKFGALSIDRTNGFYFGWASDCQTLAEAEKKAIDDCNKKGGKCTVVLSFSGTGCAVYRFITGNVGMGYGWGIANTKEEADIKAIKECAERSYGLPAPNLVYKCNSANSGELKVIYDAHNEIISTQPGTVTNY
jgi:hypothetical protein